MPNIAFLVRAAGIFYAPPVDMTVKRVILSKQSRLVVNIGKFIIP